MSASMWGTSASGEVVELNNTRFSRLLMGMVWDLTKENPESPDKDDKQDTVEGVLDHRQISTARFRELDSLAPKGFFEFYRYVTTYQKTQEMVKREVFLYSDVCELRDYIKQFANCVGHIDYN